jgi:zinc transport system substrate-binding protein
VDTKLGEAFGRLSSTPVVFSHPVYQYLQRRYEIDGHSVHWEPDVAPTEEQWEQLEKTLQTHEAKWMIWEGEPSPETVSRLSELGLQSVVVDPCGNTPEQGDYLDVMNRNIENLGSSFAAAIDEES